MAEIVLFHHIQGLTEGVRAFADELRAVGHTVHTPDLFEGRTFSSIQEGFAYASELGEATVDARANAAVEALDPELVYAGFSLGVAFAQRFAQTRPGARGALLMYSCLPVSEFGTSWPAGVPVEIHGKENDEFFEEDLPAARALVESSADAELFLYPGTQHLFADSSTEDFDPEAAKTLMTRVQHFLEKL